MTAATLSTNGQVDRSTSMPQALRKPMGKSGRLRGKFLQNDVRTLGERVASYLREQHPEKTAVCVASEIGVSAETVRKWLEQNSVPNGRVMLALIRRYRMSFIGRVLGDEADDWIAELARQEKQEQLEAEAAAIRRQLSLVMEGRAR